MWARLKEELLNKRYDASKMKVETVRTLIWRYFISYWNNRRSCSTNGGLQKTVFASALNEEDAIFLAQAIMIKNGMDKDVAIVKKHQIYPIWRIQTL